MRRRWLVPPLVLLVFAGCAEPASDSAAAPASPTATTPWPATVPCEFCYEPTILADGMGGLWIDDWSRGLTHLLANGTLAVVEGPALPDGLVTRGEPAMAIAGGALVYAFVSHNGVGVEDELLAGDAANAVLVYRHDGTSWSLAARLRPGEASGVAYTGADRPWLAAHGDRVALTWATTNPRMVEAAGSTDGGRTFSNPSQAIGPVDPLGDISPRPAVASDGSVVLPDMQGLGIASLAAPVDLPGTLEVLVWADGQGWHRRAGPSLGPGDGPGTWVAWTGTTWSPKLGFVLAWTTEGGRVLASSSPDALAWSAPAELFRLDGPGYHPWIEPAGRCVTLTAWEQDHLVPAGATLHAAVLQPDGTVERTVFVEQARMNTDFPSHAVLAGRLVAAWAADGEIALGSWDLPGC